MIERVARAFICCLVLGAGSVSGQQLNPPVTLGTPGTVVAAQVWTVSPAIDGKISAIHFTDGQQVAKGDLLVELDDRQAQLLENLAAAQAEVAKTRLQQAERDLARSQRLKRRDAVSDAALDDVTVERDLARHQVEIARIEHELAQVALDAHRVYAPSGGLMSAPLLPPGTNYSVIESGPVATVSALDPIFVRVTLDHERVLARLEQGEFHTGDRMDVDIVLRLPNGVIYPHRGKVTAVGFELDPETGDGTLHASFPNPDGLLRPGLPVTLAVDDAPD